MSQIMHFVEKNILEHNTIVANITNIKTLNNAKIFLEMLILSNSRQCQDFNSFGKSRMGTAIAPLIGHLC